MCAKMWDDNPPCEECRPVIYPGTAEAIQVYLTVQSQLLLGPEGNIIGLNFVAVGFVMDLFEIENRIRVFNDVVTLHELYTE